MTRRKFIIVGAAGCVLVIPAVALGQRRDRVWRVGFLSVRRRPDSLTGDVFGAFAQGMRELGYVEGGNLGIEWRFANGNYDQLSAHAAELVRLKVDIIVAAGTPAIGAVQKASSLVPIVMAGVGDPVGSGFAASLARPGGNVTGLGNFAVDIGPKLLEMLAAIVPKLSRIGLVVNSMNASNVMMGDNTESAARKLNIRILRAEIRSARDIDPEISRILRQSPGALIVSQDSLLIQQQQQIAKLAAGNRLPSVASFGDYAEAGGLMSYGPNVADSYRRAATYVDKIFKGAKAGDLPIEQPTRFELVVNLKTAKALGLTIPQPFLMRADRVIE